MGKMNTDTKTAARARFVPSQRRSRERYERILECAARIMAEKGNEAFRMADVVELSGVPFGSLYQYFPDKTAIIGTLAERSNAVGHACVRRELEAIEGAGDLHQALCRITDGYYQMFIDQPVMRDIWQATQADRALQELDEADGEFLADILLNTLKRVEPERDIVLLKAISRLIMNLIAATVRHAITLESREADRMIALFKHMLPKNLSSLA